MMITSRPSLSTLTRPLSLPILAYVASATSPLVVPVLTCPHQRLRPTTDVTVLQMRSTVPSAGFVWSQSKGISNGHDSPLRRSKLSHPMCSTAPEGGNRVLGKKVVAKANWLRLVEVQWQNERGQSMTWEAVERNAGGVETDSAQPSVFGVAILPILQRKGAQPEVLLITQFRPPVGKLCVEAPAGLVQQSEDMLKTAWRELEEETGLTASHVIDDDACYLYNDPGITDAGCKLLVVAVDAEEASNAEALRRGAAGEVFGLEGEGEAIRQLRLPLKGLRTELNRLIAAGYAVDGKLHCFARGIELAHTLQA